MIFARGSDLLVPCEFMDDALRTVGLGTRLLNESKSFALTCVLDCLPLFLRMAGLSLSLNDYVLVVEPDCILFLIRCGF